jgi:hypothetical protein
MAWRDKSFFASHSRTCIAYTSSTPRRCGFAQRCRYGRSEF